MASYRVKTHKAKSGQWGWKIYDAEGAEVQAGAGYGTEREADDDGWSALAEYQTWHPTGLQMFVGELRGVAKLNVSDRKVQRTVQLEVEISRDIEALVKHRDQSRNEIVNRVLSIGLEEIKAALSEDEYREIFTLDGETLDKGAREEATA